MAEVIGSRRAANAGKRVVKRIVAVQTRSLLTEVGLGREESERGTGRKAAGELATYMRAPSAHRPTPQKPGNKIMS